MARKPAFNKPTPSKLEPLGPPEPFSAAPLYAKPFFENLTRSHVYITHVDRHGADFQKRIFAVPLVLNAILAALILWRVWAITPWYYHLLLTVWGYDSPTTIDRTDKTFRDLLWILFKRTGTFTIDFVIFRIVAPWPWGFFIEEGNPVQWRWNIGFQDKEIYVRKSRGFNAEEFVRAAKERGRENPFLKVRVLPAVDKMVLREKSGYATMGPDWDLDFEAMVLAHDVLGRKEMGFEGFERKVWVYAGDAIGWCVWDVEFEEGSTDDAEFIQKLARQVDKERGA